jgi:sucrose-6-phosphate hydrolase SacC (GH32 family)
MRVERRYLHLPVENGAPERWMRLLVDGVIVREFRIELAEQEPDFWVYTEISPWQGHHLALEVEPGTPSILAQVRQEEAIPDGEGGYTERLRPQYHFSSRRGWNNDPNGLMYYDGEYHLFYQHNPYGWKHGNMHWGHAVSTDLVHWCELSEALYPDALGTCFSGSGVVDALNTAGLQADQEKTLVCIYTSAGGRTPASADKPFTQSIAYSNDRGRSWIKYLHNPVLDHIAARNRDPKVIWHEDTGQWIMALYLEENEYALYASPDLKSWVDLQQLTLPGASECPDLFPLAVDGDPADVRWVFWGANGTYLVGSFDGQRYQAEGEALRYDWGGNSYAAQTWSGIPAEDGRRIQIAWLRVDLPGMPFNQCMTFPCELTLRTTPEGIRLFSEPVAELAHLYNGTHCWDQQTLASGQHRDLALGSELLEIRAAFGLGDADAFGLTVRGITVRYDVAQGVLSCEGQSAALAPQGGEIRLQVLIDRASIEIFCQDGQVALPLGILTVDRPMTVGAFSQGGKTLLKYLEVHELEPARPSTEGKGQA